MIQDFEQLDYHQGMLEKGMKPEGVIAHRGRD